MARPKGLQKTGGRQKGTPNKRTNGFLEILDSKGINLLEEVLDEAMALEGREKANILLGLLPYIYPKRRPTEAPAFSMSDHLASLSITELANLRSEISRLMGEGKSLEEITDEQLEQYKAQAERTLIAINNLRSLRDDPYSDA